MQPQSSLSTSSVKVSGAMPTKPSAKAERLDRRREQIIAAAARIFAEKGFHEAGIADIAAELGIGHGTFYRYFKNKQDIANHVLDRVSQRIAEAMTNENPEASTNLQEYRAQVERIIHRLFDLFDQHPELVRFYNQQSAVVDAERIAVAVDGFTAFTTRFLENGVSKGFVRRDLDVEIAAQAFVGVLLDLIRRILRTPDTVALRERWAHAGVTVMFDGIAPG
jgi:AcrR family transcriptional regulator